MPTVRVCLYGGLTVFASDLKPHCALTVDLLPGDTLRDILMRLGIPFNEVGVAAINGRQADPNSVLAHGDNIVASAPVSGGACGHGDNQ